MAEKVRKKIVSLTNNRWKQCIWLQSCILTPVPYVRDVHVPSLSINNKKPYITSARLLAWDLWGKLSQGKTHVHEESQSDVVSHSALFSGS